MGDPILTVDTAMYRQGAFERMEELAAQVDGRAALEVRENSRLARAQDWKWWVKFCHQTGMPADTVSDTLLASYACALADGDSRGPLAPASIVRRISGVVYGWKQSGATVPQDVTARALLMVKGHERRLLEANQPTGRGKSPALSVKDLRRICAALPASVTGKRDRALMLIGFGIAARRSELAHLEVADIVEDDSGLEVHVRYTKTHPRQPGVPSGQSDETCPVLAWRAWVEASGVTDGPAFRGIDRHGRIGGRMSPRAVGDVITRVGERAGLERRITGHSLRSGLATAARRAGHDHVTIARQGGWSETSSSLYGYIRTVDKWTDNALKGIGL